MNACRHRADASRRTLDARRTYHKQRTSHRKLGRILVPWSRRVSAVFQDELQDAALDIVADIEARRADARLKRTRKRYRLSDEDAERVRARLLRAVRQGRERAERVQVPREEVVLFFADGGIQSVRAERQYLRGLGASPDRLAAALRVPRERLFGVDIAPSPAEREAMRAAAAACLSVISTEVGRMAQGYANQVARSVQRGARWETIAKRLEARTAMDSRHARLVARDQTNKLNSDISDATGKAAGLDRYIWRKTPDGLVRESHDEVAGLVVDANSEGVPGTGVDGEPAHPGQAIQCRCQREWLIPQHLRLDESDTSPLPEVGSRVP